MKKILFWALLFLTVFLIYLLNMDKKVYYVALGDSLNSDFDNNLGYSSYISDYLSGKDVLENYVYGFERSDYRIPDLILDINNNKPLKINNKKITLKNALIKADLITLSVNSVDFLKHASSDNLYDYIDELGADLSKLFDLIRKYCKEDIIFIGYFGNASSDTFDYLNRVYQKICDKYDIVYLKSSDFIDASLMDDVYLSTYGHKVLADNLINFINKTLFDQ